MSGGVTCRSQIVFGGAKIEGMSLCDTLGGSDSQTQLCKKLILGEIWLLVQVCFNLTTDWVHNWELVQVRAILISLIWPSIPHYPPQIQPIPRLAMEVIAEPLL